MHQCLECENMIARKDRKFCSKKCYGKNKSKKNTIHKDLLYKYYYIERLSTSEILKKLDISHRTLYNQLHKNGIKLRGQDIDYAGKIVKGSKILKIRPTKTGKHTQWECLCDCGESFNVSSQRLYNTNEESFIGCKKCTKKNTRNKRKSNAIVPNCVWYNIKNSPSVREGKREFSISKKYAEELIVSQNFKCAITGVDIHFAETAKEHSQGKSTASLDRINSSKGYIKDNVQWVHKKINCMKWDMTIEELMHWSKLILDFNKRRN